MNNRQNGRRRGRGGQQARNGQPGVPDRGNRLDNRARGNAAQLLEKYKTLARDAQMQGDRVNTEYYLQFADHYFRILSENRSRFEEQQQRGRREEYGNEGDDADGQRGYGHAGGAADYAWDDGDDQPQYQPQPPVPPQPPVQAQRPPREFQPRRERTGYEQQAPVQADAAPQAEPVAEAPARAEPAPRAEPRRERGRRNGSGNGSAGANGGEDASSGHARAVPDLAAAAESAVPARIEIDLPPALTAGEPAADEGAEAAPKRRRTRRPKAEAGSEAAQA